MGAEADWVYLISNFGFPIVISVYLLLRFEKKLERLANELDSLRGIIVQKDRS
ncbi:YvrJ family protein [Viridibacillus sp. YIM B01967]|uniref:YvrJ family protein n=1 Tax=Viridibacillus soli TaxID=2798301 RepID=A0ABS1H5Z3_9BACL|nr:YvrJ family protein [Viridibacillus soli]MBK3494706.1 YvrJ family protein [Viridibacillus soli]